MSQWRQARTATASTCRATSFLELRNARNTRKGLVDELFVLDLWPLNLFSLVDREASADNSIALFLEQDFAGNRILPVMMFALFAFFVVPRRCTGCL